MWLAAFSGFVSGLGLLLSPGPQSLFVLRQGLAREHVGSIVLICVISDAMLIALGISGLGALTGSVESLVPSMRMLGCVVLLVYGTMRIRASKRTQSLDDIATPRARGRARVLSTCLALTWANPAVYIDTVVFIGSMAVQHRPWELAFGTGAASASLAFFSALGFGGALLGRHAQDAQLWARLELIIGITMICAAVGLL